MEIQRYFTGTEWEPKVGYCRALRAGNTIYISGTAPINEDGSTFAPGEAYAQARRCFEIVQKSLEAIDSSLSQVVRTRMYVTDISRWQEYGRAHQEAFAAHPPVTAMVEVKGLISPDMLIEVEVEAVVG
ncbi:MAG: RidA family protein [Phormidesmis sp.]